MDQRRRLTAAIREGIDQADRLRADAELAKLRSELAATKTRYGAALRQIDLERERADSLAGLAGLQAKAMPRPSKPARPNAATALVVLSDWHCEETVTREQTAGLNAFDLEVADLRISELARRIGVLVEHERQLVKIDRIVIAALGDFISGHIHDDTAEMAQLAPLARPLPQTAAPTATTVPNRDWRRGKRGIEAAANDRLSLPHPFSPAGRPAAGVPTAANLPRGRARG
jgi:hypothetical protein